MRNHANRSVVITAAGRLQGRTRIALTYRQRKRKRAAKRLKRERRRMRQQWRRKGYIIDNDLVSQTELQSWLVWENEEIPCKEEPEIVDDWVDEECDDWVDEENEWIEKEIEPLGFDEIGEFEDEIDDCEDEMDDCEE